MEMNICEIITENIKNNNFITSEVKIEKTDDFCIYIIDDLFELKIKSNTFSISMKLGGVDFGEEMNMEEMLVISQHQEDLISISQYLYMSLDEKPKIETVFIGICEYPYFIISFENIILTQYNISLFLFHLLKAFNSLFLSTEKLFKGINYYEYINTAAANFPEEGEFLIQIKNFIKKLSNQIIYQKNNDFSEFVFKIIHDFVFYSRQSARVLNGLKEDYIRDILLIPLRINNLIIEGEAFNYDGKADFKIINSDSKYEFIIGELKWWKGIHSFKNAFHQATIKHATGQEKQIYIVMLSKNNKLQDIKNEIKEYLSNEGYEHSKMLLPLGSQEFFIITNVVIRDKICEVIITIIDLYYLNT